MGCFKAYIKDKEEEKFNNSENKVTTLDYYKQIIKESLFLEEEALIVASSEEVFSKIVEKNKEILGLFWEKLDNVNSYKIDKKSETFNQLIDQLSDKELSYVWEAKGKKEYKIISIFNIIDQFFVKFTDNSTQHTRTTKSQFWWIKDKENEKKAYEELNKAEAELKNSKKTKEQKEAEIKVKEAKSKVNNLTTQFKLTPEIFPPIFLFEDENFFYFMINTKAPLLYFSINDSNKRQVSYYFNEEKKYKSGLKIKLTKSSGGYIGRPDSMDEIDYRWSIKSGLNEDEKEVALKLAYYINLGIKEKRDINNENELEYKEIVDSKEVTFYKTNTPTTYGNLKNKPDLITFFNFYKVLKKDVVKKNFPKDNIRKPLVFDNTIAKANKDKDNIEIENIYVLDSHKILYKSKNKRKEISTNPKKRESTGAVMANSLKDFSLFTPLKDIQYDAKDITPNKTKLTDTNCSATSFAQYVLCEDEISNQTWKTLYFKENNTYENTKKESILKNYNGISKVNTDQEWCHLLGHADGGADEFGNLVSGSKHCNTEQLSMEIGQSRFIKATHKNINANITAYLVKSKIIARNKAYSKEELTKLLGFDNSDKFDKFSKKDIFTNIFILEDNKYKINEKDDYKDDFTPIYNTKKEKLDKIEDLSSEEKEERKIEYEEIRSFEENLLKIFFETLPLAENMRYKHYFEEQKIFDHIFDAQNESICSLECKILDYTLEMNLYIGTKDWDGYKKVLENRVKKKLPSDKTLKEDENIISNLKNSNIAKLNQKRKREEVSSSEVNEEIQKKVCINIENNVSAEEIKEINEKKENVYIENILGSSNKIEEEK